MKRKKSCENVLGFKIIRTMNWLTWPSAIYRVFSYDYHLIAVRYSRRSAVQLCYDLFNMENDRTR